MGSKKAKNAAHPTYKEMIAAAIRGLKQRGGSSRQAIAKYISSHYKVGANSNVHLRMAIKRALASGMLVRSAAHSGTFRLNAAALKKPKKSPKKKKAAKKPKAKKAKKPKKKTAAKKKKTTKKTTKKKTTKRRSLPKRAKQKDQQRGEVPPRRPKGLLRSQRNESIDP